VGEVTIDFRILVTTTGSGIPSRFHLIYRRKKGVNLVSTGLPRQSEISPQYGYFAFSGSNSLHLRGTKLWPPPW
jgi:hypothetical protein